MHSDDKVLTPRGIIRQIYHPILRFNFSLLKKNIDCFTSQLWLAHTIQSCNKFVSRYWRFRENHKNLEYAKKYSTFIICSLCNGSTGHLFHGRINAHGYESLLRGRAKSRRPLPVSLRIARSEDAPTQRNEIVACFRTCKNHIT